MNVVIMGCGRVGSRLATIMDAEGHRLTVVDVNPAAFSRLSSSYGGETVVGDATDEDVQREAGVVDADVFVAVTQGDNRNIMASQVAKHLFQVDKVVCRIYDPIRQEVFRDLGLRTFSPTTVLTQMIHDTIEG
ncbi:MAG: TrkA family potassium uptake protein [Chloroflexi bacterium]|nr:TrkA family potassium uptake protein [Chloroflexota bacterium]MCH8194567.1 TrkA family potassium uptake protein [Chloroflexota bacterium]MCH8283384.1 TrkA family potassium uptake protein [Chloroflexota bacterium]MCI0769762.1 TrkA family potassium uptake protein [Chloroflexota bacterium]